MISSRRYLDIYLHIVSCLAVCQYKLRASEKQINITSLLIVRRTVICRPPRSIFKKLKCRLTNLNKLTDFGMLVAEIINYFGLEAYVKRFWPFWVQKCVRTFEFRMNSEQAVGICEANSENRKNNVAIHSNLSHRKRKKLFR